MPYKNYIQTNSSSQDKNTCDFCVSQVASLAVPTDTAFEHLTFESWFFSVFREPVAVSRAGGSRAGGRQGGRAPLAQVAHLGDHLSQGGVGDRESPSNSSPIVTQRLWNLIQPKIPRALWGGYLECTGTLHLEE